jgi:polysaccharide biosynthesis protein PslG
VGRRRLLLVAAAALAAVGAACGPIAPSPAAGPSAPQPSGSATPTGSTTLGRLAGEPAVGVNVHAMWDSYSDADRQAIYSKLASAGVTWVRIDVGWAGVEPSPGQFQNNGYTQLADTAVNEARAAGLKVLIVFWWSPTWANNGGSRATPPTDPNTYAQAIGWAAQHFAGRVSAWEVWNEPNETDFWTGSPAQYSALLRAAYPAVKAGDPNATVVLAGPAYNDTNWLGGVYAGGVSGAFDVLATHPYMSPASSPPETADDGSIYNLSHVAAVKAMMNAHGDGAKPIWFTEFGWSSHANSPGLPDWQQGVTPAQQGDYLVRSLRWLAQNASYVTNAFWYEERDQTSQDIQNNNYGLLDSNLNPKPAYSSLSSHLHS